MYEFSRCFHLKPLNFNIYVVVTKDAFVCETKIARGPSKYEIYEVEGLKALPCQPVNLLDRHLPVCWTNGSHVKPYTMALTGSKVTF